VKGLKQGDKYAISIDCTKVLNGILPRDTVSNSGAESEALLCLITGELSLTNEPFL